MEECPPLCIVLTLAGLLAAAGGVVMLFRGATDRDAPVRGPYTPLAATFIGLMIAYRSFTAFESLQPLDLVIMFVFALGLLSLLGIQLFIVDRNKGSQ
jgi:peptidoglycan/LPS O-acetylase OafA/YrhL